jgi:hypothetical protein
MEEKEIEYLQRMQEKQPIQYDLFVAFPAFVVPSIPKVRP